MAETVALTMGELDRLQVMSQLAERGLTRRRAAALLGLSERQVRRLYRVFRRDGAKALASRHRGRPSNRQLASATREHALTLVRERYADFGPTFAHQKLTEQHGLAFSVETLRGWMTAAGLWVPRAQRLRRSQPPRPRRAWLGELVQIDGSEHAWFEDRGPVCTLLVYVDDATSRLMELAFAEVESTFDYFRATRRYLERHGKPMAIYSDRLSVFHVHARERAQNLRTARGSHNSRAPCGSSTSTSSARAVPKPRGGSNGPTAPCRTGSSKSCGSAASTIPSPPPRSFPSSWPTTTGASPNRPPWPTTRIARCAPKTTSPSSSPCRRRVASVASSRCTTNAISTCSTTRSPPGDCAGRRWSSAKPRTARSPCASTTACWQLASTRRTTPSSIPASSSSTSISTGSSPSSLRNSSSAMPLASPARSLPAVRRTVSTPARPCGPPPCHPGKAGHLYLGQERTLLLCVERPRHRRTLPLFPIPTFFSGAHIRVGQEPIYASSRDRERGRRTPRKPSSSTLGPSTAVPRTQPNGRRPWQRGRSGRAAPGGRYHPRRRTACAWSDLRRPIM